MIVPLKQGLKPRHGGRATTKKRGQNSMRIYILGDLRWNKAGMLIRTAKDYEDFTGGSNHYASLETVERFEEDFSEIMLVK